MDYRREIDGLRAIAVVPVILFHAGIGIVPGGFLGVDIFFVISGYLITSIIVRELAEGNFSLLRFYERRARRILPALFLMMMTVFVLAWLWLVPDEFQLFSESLIQTSLSISNFYFLENSGYFAPSASETPLLHTWSLAVEEQFYLLFPLLALLAWKRGYKTLFWTIATIALSSLLLAEAGSRYFPQANFYLLPSRAWELLAGALIGLVAFKHGEKESPVLSDNLLALAGFGLIVFSFFFYEETMALPSLATLVPVLGTVMVLYFARRGTWVAGLLSARFLVGIGLISYSAYLWHQPLFVFARLKSLAEPSPAFMLFLSGICLVLAWGTWRYVEEPFRRRKIRLFPDFKRVAATAVATMAMFIGLGSYGVETEGAPQRLPQEIRQFLETTVWNRHCLMQSDGVLPEFPAEDCIFDKAQPVRYALWGDSIASSLNPALATQLSAQGISLTQLTHGNCAPILGVRKADADARNCVAFNDKALTYLETNGIDTVVMAGLWDELFSHGVIFRDGTTQGADDVDTDRLIRQLQQTLARLQKAGIRILLVYPHPTLQSNAKQSVAKLIMNGDQTPQIEITDGAFRAQSAAAYRMLDAQTISGLIRSKPADLFCDIIKKGNCVLVDRGKLFLVDKTHYSETGAEMVSHQILQALGFDVQTKGHSPAR